jgi:hypothetical protein
MDELEFEQHCCLVAYNFWAKLEQEGGVKWDHRDYLLAIGKSTVDSTMCPSCTIARRRASNICTDCKRCPVESWSCTTEVSDCTDDGSHFDIWQNTALYSHEEKVSAGDVARIMQKWGERIGVFAKRS